jgi:Glyoxalase-like domain
LIDHIVYGVPRHLAQAVAWFAGLRGVQPVRGGSHEGMGTANFLIGLGAGAYLEIIGPDPDQPQPVGARWFGIDRLTAPRIVTWAIRTANIDSSVAAARASGYDPGQPTAMSRRTDAGDVLHWRLTPPQIEHNDGLVPFLIDWGSTPHPTSRGLPRTRLTSWTAIHPTPGILHGALAALGCQLDIAAGDRPELTAVIEGDHGLVTLT